ncbi:hypothetical protein GCM10025780_07790 [Frondihabitans cladoniiphilus]|uniref:Uncharacterized protein n=1 Tax=Frondihabitans cladoniiphilus TaxID=715785 RepID=A0ABP8VNH6_9MICO
MLSGLYEQPAQALPSVLGRDRQLLQVADTADLQDVHKARDRAMLEFRDEKKSRLTQSGNSRGRRRPGRWLQPMDEKLIGVVLDPLDDLCVSLLGKADTGHATSVELALGRTPLQGRSRTSHFEGMERAGRLAA